MDFIDYLKKIVILIVLIFFISKSKVNNELLLSDKKATKLNYTFNHTFNDTSKNSKTNSTNPIKVNESNLTNFNTNKNNSKTYNIFINPYYPQEAEEYKKFLEFIDMPKDPNDPLIEEEKKKILEKMSPDKKSPIDTVYFNVNFRFGNQMLIMNKLIFYCEIIGCTKILLNPMMYNALYINDTIFYEKYNMTFEVLEHNDVDELNRYSVINYDYYFFYTTYTFKIENRLNVIKNEMFRNLPKVNISSKDLYIHVRSGDLFEHELSDDHAPSYAQYPLCFYEKVIKNNKFKKIYIIAEDKNNPVIDKLIEKYPNVIYNNHTLEEDISYLANAYNIIGSVSSFVVSIIKINDNLKFYWEHDNYQIDKKVAHLHHTLYNFPRKYTIFIMEPSEQYKKHMYIWKRSDEQLKIMLNDTCPNDFKVIKPNI